MHKTKKQHYVPQCYLRHFGGEHSDYLFVYDKKSQKCWRSAICDVAAEGYFYDLSFAESLEADTLAFLHSHNVSLEQLKEDQTIEKYLASKIEKRYSELLSSLSTRFKQLTPWTEKNCTFLSREEKEEFSYYLTVQMLRTRAVRDSILDSADCLQQVLIDMGIKKENVDQFSLKESQAGNIQGRMLLDTSNILKTAKLLNQLTWVLYINRTSHLLYTSDSPVTRKAHAKHSFLSMTGLTSPGVELCIPISSNLLLIMIEGNFHKLPKSIDRTWKEMNFENVRHYNARCIYQSHRYVYSSTDDFSFLLEIAKKDPKVFKNGTEDTVHWGGKIYTPRKR
jgi:hypothetical protein